MIDERPILKMRECEVPIFVESIAIALGVDGVFVELGVAKATSTRVLLMTLQRLRAKRSVYSIDHGECCVDHHEEVASRYAGESTATFILADTRTHRFSPSKPLAWLYVDACHRYGHVIRDVDNWLPHVVPGGVVVFHDSWRKGVMAAIRETIGRLREYALIDEARGAIPGIAAYARRMRSGKFPARLPFAASLAVEVRKEIGGRALPG